MREHPYFDRPLFAYLCVSIRDGPITEGRFLDDGLLKNPTLPGSSPLTSHYTALYLDPDPEEDNMIRSFSLADVTMAYGFPVEDPAAGSAEGYIGDDHHFYGVLHLGKYSYITRWVT
jgi:hypothetical protein